MSSGSSSAVLNGQVISPKWRPYAHANEPIRFTSYIALERATPPIKRFAIQSSLPCGTESGSTTSPMLPFYIPAVCVLPLEPLPNFPTDWESASVDHVICMRGRWGRRGRAYIYAWCNVVWQSTTLRSVTIHIVINKRISDRVVRTRIHYFLFKLTKGQIIRSFSDRRFDTNI
jgi:hypothetical protein